MTSRAVILAGGRGTRLLPYTTTIPKPLMPIGDRPILDIVLRQLSAQGLTDVTIATGYLAELVEAFVGDGSAYGLHVDYFREREPLGTVGCIASIERLDEPFVVLNGDVLTDLDYRELLDDHVASGAAATIATHTREVEVSLGVVELGDGGDARRLTDYIEKPTTRYEASMGIYCFRPDVPDGVVADSYLDIPDLVLALIARGELVRSWQGDHAYWRDIGRPDDYEQAQDDFERLRERLLPSDVSVDKQA